MKNSILLIAGIVTVAAVMIPVFYNPLTDYYKYTVPIKNSEISPDSPHPHSTTFVRMNHTLSRELMDLTLLDEQTIKISFRIPEELPPYPINHFEDFEREFTIGDSFVIY